MHCLRKINDKIYEKESSNIKKIDVITLDLEPRMGETVFLVVNTLQEQIATDINETFLYFANIHNYMRK